MIAKRVAMLLMRQTLNSLSRGKLSVFLFHRVPAIRDNLLPQEITTLEFIKALDFICENYNILPLADATHLLQSGRLPVRAAAITFDDGYLDWNNGVARILSERSCPATFFITTGQLEGRALWQERLANIMRRQCHDEFDGRRFGLPVLSTRSVSEKIVALRALEFHFKYLPLVIRDHYLEQLESQFEIKSFDENRFSIRDLLSIANKGFEIGAHTHNHPILSLCDSEQAEREIGIAREILEGIIKRPIKGFAYPNGRPLVDFSWRNVDMVKKVGYQYAVTTQWGVANHKSSCFQIPRFTPWGPSESMMSVQLIRNLIKAPMLIAERSST